MTEFSVIPTFPPRLTRAAISMTPPTACPPVSGAQMSTIVSNFPEFSRRLQAGTIWTNTWMDGFPEMPFGGFKQSGSGRELGRYGLDEFLEVKTLTMRIAARVRLG
jgi:hypothetical protein